MMIAQIVSSHVTRLKKTTRKSDEGRQVSAVALAWTRVMLSFYNATDADAIVFLEQFWAGGRVVSSFSDTTGVRRV